MKKHTYYHTCPYCGANLDPGEKCDCRERLQPAVVNNEGMMIPDRKPRLKLIERNYKP